MRSCWILAVCVACGAEPRAGKRPEVAAEVDVPPAADAAARVASAEARWLAGDLEAAIAELERAGGDPRARALLARAYSIAGRPADAKRIATRAIGGGHPEPRVATDVSKIERVELSRDGAYVATIERAERYSVLPTITIWSSLTGRALYTAAGDHVAFGRAATGEMLVVIVAGNDGQVRALDAATGEERWAHELDRTWDVAVDTHHIVTTLTAPDSHLVQWDLATGARLRALPNDSNGAVMSMSADGTTVLAAETLLDLAHDADARKLAVLPSATMASGIVDLRVSPDGQLVAVSNQDRSVLLYDRTGTVVTRIPNAGAQVEFLDDNTIVATDGKRITRWDHAGTKLADFGLPADLAPIDRDRLVIGGGGHVVMRRGAELVMLQVATNRPAVIARFGFRTRADTLAWSADGSELVIAGTRDGDALWQVTGRLTTSPKPVALVAAPQPHALELDGNRVFARDRDGHVVHFFEAREPITAAATDGRIVVAADATGTLDVWNADTAEGLGTIPGTAPVTALALRDDGRTLAVARKTGGIELWDLPSRSHVLTIVAAPDTWLVFTPSGHVDGQPRGFDWLLGDAVFPGDSFGVAEHGLAATVLAHPPPAIAVTPTPATELEARPCLPKDLVARPIAARLAGNVFAFCFAEDRSDPYCFALDIATRAVAPAVPPLDVLAPPHDDDDHSHGAKIDQTDDGLEVCVTPDSCRTLATTNSEDADRVAVSEDGVVAAVAFPGNRMETWNVLTGKRIARFKIHYGTRDNGEQGGRSISFWGHNILAVFTPCAGPCGDGTVFSPRGKDLGAVPFEPSGMGATRFHDNLWVLASFESGFAIADATTNDLVAEHDASAFQIATDSDHVAAVFERKHVGRAVVYGRLGKLVAEAKAPRCK